MRARPLLALSLAALLGFGAGFGWFVHTAWRTPTSPPHADGIVVLTGGAERVNAGLRLLQDHAADRLLVSGVGRAADFRELAHLAGVGPAVAPTLAPRVTLGRHAATTRGNAMETADWAALNHVTSLIVVTAGYHMPRALAELRRRLPGVALYPVQVQPAGPPWSWRLLFSEYVKFLAAEIGLGDMPDRPDLVGQDHGS